MICKHILLIMFLKETELILFVQKIELFDHLNVYLQHVFTNHMFNIYVKTGLMCHECFWRVLWLFTTFLKPSIPGVHCFLVLEMRQSFFGCVDGPVRTRDVWILQLDYVKCWYVSFSDMPNEAMHNVSTHQLPRYNQPQRLPTKTWTVSLTIYAPKN